MANLAAELLGTNLKAKPASILLAEKNMDTKEKIELGKLEAFFYGLIFIRSSMVITHVSGIWVILLIFQGKVLLSTMIFSIILMELSGIGLSMGAHRLWAHKTYKARTPLKIFLAFCFSFAGQHSLWHWASNHRLHHKYSDTENDPHNPSRGFFYSHIGWLLNYDHQKFRRNVKKIDITDLELDKVVMFHDKYFAPITLLSMVILPTLGPHYLFGESLFNGFCVAAGTRYMLDLHRTLLINSAAHKWGYKHFDNSIPPTNNFLVQIFTQGEGMHNHHHVFPWDYKSPELGFIPWSFPTYVIEFFAKFGWAYDLKTVSNELMVKRAQRTGDGSFVPEKHFSGLTDDVTK